MEPKHTVGALLVCCSALWVVSSSMVEASPPRCDSRLGFPTEVSSSDGNGDIHLRSLSPWSWGPSPATHQIPSTIWEAKCSSSSCSGPGAGRDLNSVPIYQNLLVLTRQEREHCFTASYRSVAVGCTCVRARTVQD
ncbi:interleukin 17a/f2 [Spinachia spinachia]